MGPASDSVTVRAGREDDLAAIEDLYAHYVRETAVTFDLEPPGMDRRREWFARYRLTGKHRLLVADEAGRVVGFATSGPYRDRRAYETTVEVSVYLVPDATGRGIGTRLYQALFEAIGGEDVHRACAGVTLPNPASVALHERFGFHRVGLFTEQGRKFGRYWDVGWYERPMEG